MSSHSHPVALRFGRNLCFHRKHAGISQEDLGRLASLHRTEIGLLERGERIPRIDTLIKLASALSVPSEALLRGIDWRSDTVRQGEFEVTNLGDGDDS